MSRLSLRTQLFLLGVVAAVTPVVVLVLVVFGVEEDETVDATGDSVDVVVDAGVSPWIPVTAVLLAGAAVVGVRWWAKRAVDPIEQMTRLTDEIQAGSLHRRLALERAPAEVRALGDSFDRMLDRLAAASTVERRLIEDASHDLRTPLAALATRLEVVARSDAGSAVAEDLARCDRDVQRLQDTLDSLLASTRTRQSELEQVDNDVVAVVARVVERHRLLVPDVSIEMHSPDRAVLGIDGTAIERAVDNLVDNAVVHGRGTPVSVEVRDTADAVEIVVTDEGPGIDRDRLPHVFDRYAGDGHGIGLALVRQVAAAYGEVVADSPIADGRGARFTLRLRRAQRGNGAPPSESP